MHSIEKGYLKNYYLLEVIKNANAEKQKE